LEHFGNEIFYTFCFITSPHTIVLSTKKSFIFCPPNSSLLPGVMSMCQLFATASNELQILFGKWSSAMLLLTIIFCAEQQQI